jgi:hypothetical protein
MDLAARTDSTVLWLQRCAARISRCAGGPVVKVKIAVEDEVGEVVA